MVPGAGTELCQFVGRKGRGATSSLDEHNERQLADSVRDCILQGACKAPVPFVLALRVALTEFEDEMRKQGVQFTTELEYWAHVDDTTIASTAELAPIVMPHSEGRSRNMAWSCQTTSAAQFKKEQPRFGKK